MRELPVGPQALKDLEADLGPRPEVGPEVAEGCCTPAGAWRALRAGAIDGPRTQPGPTGPNPRGGDSGPV